MAKLPEPNHATAAKIFAHYERNAETGNRPHLGASLIGRQCERFLWLTFRWADIQNFSGRMLRLFETGQLEERRLVANLRAIGVEVHDTDPSGQQWRVSAVGGHFGGSMDAAALNVPEAPKTWHVAEFKTANQKSFDDMTKQGVQKSKPEHFAQMQAYMGLTGMTRALYVMVNKNTDDLHVERIEFDEDEFQRIMDRAERIVKAAEPPLRISKDPSWWQCKNCLFSPQCHGDQVPRTNCRTCAHSTPELTGDGVWTCAHLKKTLTLDEQRAGCPSHRYMPVALEKFAEMVSVKDGAVMYKLADGTVFVNGEGETDYLSEEIRNADKRMLGNEMVAQIKQQFGARVGADE